MIGSHPSSRARTPRPRGSGRHHDHDVFEGDAAMLNELDHDELGQDEELDEELDEEEMPVGRHGAMGMYGGPVDFAFQSRSYDDEDEALQLALKASMEGLPQDFVMPELKPIQPPSILRSPPLQAAPVAPAPELAKLDNDDAELEELEEDDDDEPAKALSPGEFCPRSASNSTQKRSALRASPASSNGHRILHRHTSWSAER